MSPTLVPGPGGVVADPGGGLFLSVAACVLGGVLMALGAWLVWGGRGKAPLPHGGRLGRLSLATRTVLGLSAMLLGYHAASWASPGHWLPFRVPVERWYVLVGGVVAAAGLSLLTDRRQASSGRA